MQFVRINNLVVHYKWIDHDKDTTFVFINSLGTDFRIWEGVAARLHAYGNILLYDKRGHGLSDTSAKMEKLEAYAHDLWLLLNHLAIQKCVVVGLSVGGIIAQLLAYHHPGKISKLLLCDTRHKIGFTELWNNRINQIKEYGLQSIAEDLMQRWFAPYFHIAHPDVVKGCRNMLERCDKRGYIQTCEAIRDADTTAIAKGIQIPTLCIVGAEDKSTTPEEVKTLAGLIAGAQFQVIEGSGHIPCMDNPEKLSNLIIDFIKA